MSNTSISVNSNGSINFSTNNAISAALAAANTMTGYSSCNWQTVPNYVPSYISNYVTDNNESETLKNYIGHCTGNKILSYSEACSIFNDVESELKEQVIEWVDNGDVDFTIVKCFDVIRKSTKIVTFDFDRGRFFSFMGENAYMVPAILSYEYMGQTNLLELSSVLTEREYLKLKMSH